MYVRDEEEARPSNKSKRKRERARETERKDERTHARGRSGGGRRESGAARAPKRCGVARRAAPATTRGSASESHPVRSSGASVSQPTLRDAVIIPIVCPLLEGGFLPPPTLSLSLTLSLGFLALSLSRSRGYTDRSPSRPTAATATATVAGCCSAAHRRPRPRRRRRRVSERRVLAR